MGRKRPMVKDGGTKPTSINKRRSYSDEEMRAAVILTMEKGIDVASRQLGIPRTTIHAWYSGERHYRVKQYVMQHRGELAKAFDEVAWLCIMTARDKVDKAPLNHLMNGAGTAVDKARLLRGEATTINQNENTNNTQHIDISKLTPEERASLLMLLEKARHVHDITTTQPTGGDVANGSQQPPDGVRELGGERPSIEVRAEVVADTQPE